MARPRKYTVNLTDEDVRRLKKIIRNTKTSQTIRCRCQILLLLDLSHGQKYEYEEIAAVTGSCITTVSNTVKAYCTSGLDSLLELGRSVNSDNARRKVDGRIEAKLIEIACGPIPDGHCRWTLRLLEEKARVELETPVSREAIRRALKKTGFDLTSQITGASRQKRTRNS